MVVICRTSVTITRIDMSEGMEWKSRTSVETKTNVLIMTPASGRRTRGWDDLVQGSRIDVLTPKE